MIIKIINSLEEPEDHWDWEDCEVEGAIEEQANLKMKIIIQNSLCTAHEKGTLDD